MNKYPSPEEEPKGPYFVIQQPEQIYQTPAKGIEGISLTDTLLERPLHRIVMNLVKTDSTFDLRTVVEYDTFDAARGNINVDDIIHEVVKTLPDSENIRERGGNYMFNGPRGTRLLLGGTYSHLWLTTGEIISDDDEDEEEDEEEPERLLPPPELDGQVFNDALMDCVETLENIASASYESIGKFASDQEIAIKPPKQSVNNRLGRAALRATKDITDRLEVKVTGINFDDIGGQSKAKQEVEGLAFALSNPDLYRRWGTRPPKGILLYGPPGTGKTLLAQALAAKADARFLHVKAPDIGSMWYGESEQIIQGIFDYAVQGDGKTIIYFDEIDSIVPRREDSHEATQKIVGTLLQNLSGLDENENVMVIASTNRKDNVDEAMLRPGRLDRLVEVGLPDEQGREEIFGVHSSKANQIAQRDLFIDVDFKQASVITRRYSGADIAEIIRRTLEKKVRQEGSGSEASPISTDDILAEIAVYEHIGKNQTRHIGF